MQNADRKRVIKGTRERQIVNIGLDDVRIRKTTSCRERSFNGRAEVNPNHLTRSPLGGQLSMTPFAATTFEYDLIFEEIRRDRSDPAQKLLFILLISLSEVRPLPAEPRSRRGL